MKIVTVVTSEDSQEISGYPKQTFTMLLHWTSLHFVSVHFSPRKMWLKQYNVSAGSCQKISELILSGQT